MKIYNLTEHTIPNGAMIFMSGYCGPGEVLAIRRFNPGDTRVMADPVPLEDAERALEWRDDTVLEDR